MTADHAPLGRRIAMSIGLSLFFLIVYGGCLMISSKRENIPSFYFAWEPHTPFVAAAIIPYMSIDLFFVTAPLLLTARRELNRYALRILLAIGFAGLCFLLVPLKFAFDRPAVDGAIGYFFQQFQKADLPFNQFPSLHIALLMLVGEVFLRRTRGTLRLALLGWFSLIAVSPVLVYQHHVIDIVGGLALGLILLTLFDDREREPFERNVRVAIYYLAATLLLTATSVYLGRSSWPLWWVALSFGVATIGYFFFGPVLYAKRDGRLSLATRLLLWPMMLGQVASHRRYARWARSYDKLTDRVWIGRWLNDREAATACGEGVGAVIDLTCEFTEPTVFRSLAYLHLPTLDLTAPTQAQLAKAVAFIEEHEPTKTVYIHCKAGYSRTAAVAAAYLLATGQANSVDEAIAELHRVRPTMIVRSEVRRALDAFAAGATKKARKSLTMRALDAQDRT